MIDMEVKTLEYGNIICKPEWKVIEKGTQYHRVYYVFGGNTVYEDSQVKLKLEKGNIYIFPVNRPYEIFHNPDDPLKCLWFHILTIPTILNSVEFVSVNETSALFYQLQAIRSVVGNRSAEFLKANFMLSHLVESLVLLLNIEISFSTLSNERLIKVIDVIHEHYHEKLLSQYLSDLIHFDHSYFIRLFKKTFGVTPQRYISNYRLNKATTFLLKDVPVAKVADMVGYQDVKAFSRAFTKAKGMSPSQYSKSQSLQP